MPEAMDTLAAAIVVAAVIQVNPDMFKGGFPFERVANDVDTLSVFLAGKRLQHTPQKPSVT